MYNITQQYTEEPSFKLCILNKIDTNEFVGF